ncbi:protein of unknown function DUF1239 [Desulfurobacterium thermolithotrophum DSM 11699]|uniref:LPS export ABC transporter periplasmic protein LptC n=1 Tax=Desulfurobacterium thermolithotrophum (strain DSM 11699 / BSA) TaxID=868864 RepID=F0S0C6_DESTD|nr:LPS export ABC transporter periplasmic protein LptC [Desulfurobacterium thermolithotrophum]ADY73805.1 protein of unknown function DUF1239 [Desulfurobacterium thermolithotrophum DSM 11699]
MREKFFKVAVFLAIISILPFIVLIMRKETPPEKLNVETHKKQVIKDFVLKSEGVKKWILRAPKALFEGEEIHLKKPQLVIYDKDKFFLIADEAVYYQNKKLVHLKQVTLIGKNLRGKAPYGTYYTDKEIFTTKTTCEFTFDNDKRVTGKGCQLELKDKKVIIQSNVKSKFGEAIK